MFGKHQQNPPGLKNKTRSLAGLSSDDRFFDHTAGSFQQAQKHDRCCSVACVTMGFCVGQGNPFATSQRQRL